MRPVSACLDGSVCFDDGIALKRPAHLRSKRLCTSKGTTLIADALSRDSTDAHGNAPP